MFLRLVCIVFRSDTEDERKRLGCSLCCVWGLPTLNDDIVLVVHCGQTQARETMQLLKKLPADVWLKLMQSIVDQQEK